jgi:hypothetical protein
VPLAQTLETLFGEGFILQQKAYVLHEQQGLTDDEIAEVFVLTAATKTRLRRETISKYRATFRRKLAAFRFQFPGCDSSALLQCA